MRDQFCFIMWSQNLIRIHLATVVVAAWAMLWAPAHATADQLPSVEELRAQVLRPRRQLEFGAYLLTVTEEQGSRRTDIRVRFRGDCVRKDSYAPAD